MSAYKFNLKGKMFGKWYVRREATNCKDGAPQWECRCYGCFRIVLVRSQSLLSGTSKSCGCSSITHGLCRGGKSREYKSWVQIKGRTLNPKNEAYADYGGRGITICARWRESFAAFLQDVGKRPFKTSIERIDNNAGYTCGKCDECTAKQWTANCRWATPKQQCNNRRSNVLIHARGKTQTLTQWSDEIGVPIGTVWKRLRHLGWTHEQVISPIDKHE